MGKWTRRAFITAGVLSGGAVIFGVAIRPGNRADKVKKLVAQGEETVLNVWLKIAPDNTITAIIPHAEMGQGIHTTLAMMLADELDADWSTIRIQEAPAHKEYANYAMAKGLLAGETDFPAFLVDTVDGVFLSATKMIGLQLTGGSFSVALTGRFGMRVAGAAAKAMLLEAAATNWKVPVKELQAEKSHIHHTPSKRSAPFATFAPQAAQLSAPAKPQLKSPEAFTIMGTSPPRFDIPAKVNGTAQFGIDVRLPGMKWATIKAAPVFGQKIRSVDATAAEKIAGVRKVVQLDDAVAVIADGYWQAKLGADMLLVNYENDGKESLNQEDLYQQITAALDTALAKGEETIELESGDVARAMEEAVKTVSAEYKTPFLAHAPMEPMNCTAWFHDGKCELWTGSQNPLGFVKEVAEALDLDADNVILHNQFLGGGFGRRGMSDATIQAARIAATVDYPVQLIWSREEDMRHDHYRQATISRLKAGLSREGFPIAWEHQFVDKHDPPNASHIPYDIEHQRIHYTEHKIHVPWGYWRSVDHSVHAFFTESFIDELAHAAQQDPLQYRLALLQKNERAKNLLELVADKADWEAPLPARWGKGIAIHNSFGTLVAQVVEVEILEGVLRVHRVVCAADAGIAIHRDGFIAQMESGIVYGLTAALYGKITIDKGAVVQSNFHDYPMLRMNEAPLIETHILNSGHHPGGAGEPSTPVIAPALVNAVFAATGKRIRELPLQGQNFV